MASNMTSENLIVTIMAAGEGKRMNSDIPKVLHLFKGIPMLVRIIRECLELNPCKIIIITGKYDKLIQETIFKYVREHHCFEKKVELISELLVFVKQENPQGTGHAIKCTLDTLPDDSNSNVLILNGDMPLVSNELLKKFIGLKSLLTARLMVADLKNPFGYGRIITDSESKMVGIKEQKDCTEEEKQISLVNVGMYYVKGYILKKYIPLISNENAQKEYYLTDLVKVFLEGELEVEKESSEHSIFEYYCIEEEMKYQIYGVNTQQELKDLENSCKV